VARDTVDIILPNRIGDLILTLPAILCLKQLETQYTSNRTGYRLLTHLPLVPLLKDLNLFDVVQINLAIKTRSWISPSNKAFFLSTTSKNIGFHAKTTYGMKLSNKKLIRYSVNLPYMHFPDRISSLPGELVTFLKNKFRLTNYSIKHFGICLELGYTVDQIKKTFHFDCASLSPSEEFFDWKPSITSKYLVFCMEAASGRKKNNADRRWKEENFLDLAEMAYEKYGMQVAFIGINDQPELPKKSYFLDFRKKLDLKQIALLLHSSSGYVGNDTGPLHLANLMKKNSIGMYFREVAVVNYSPIFPQYNKIFYMPQNPEEIYQALEDLCLSAVGRTING
jgi:ADP-heptose:LPS heptosyltransferase